MLHRGLLFGPVAGAALVSAALIVWRPSIDAVSLRAQSMPQAVSAMVTPQQSQTFQIELPDAVGQNAALQLVILASAYRPPRGGGTSYVVNLRTVSKSAVPSQEVEVGRFGIFPTEAFSAKQPADGRRFGFSMTRALLELGTVRGPLEVVISAERTRKAAADETNSGELTIASVVVETAKHE